MGGPGSGRRKADDVERDMDLIGIEATGARAETKELARRGPPVLEPRADVGERRRQMAQYRACVALMWSREKILEETGWSTNLLLAVEKHVEEDDRRLHSDVDPRTLFAEYKLQQLQAARELENLAETFRALRQYTALVAAVKTRSDILDRIVKTGQELGVVKRAAREVTLTGRVDFASMSVEELRIHLVRERGEVERLLEPAPAVRGVAGAVLARVLARGGAGPRVRRLAGGPAPDVAPEAPSGPVEAAGEGGPPPGGGDEPEVLEAEVVEEEDGGEPGEG